METFRIEFNAKGKTRHWDFHANDFDEAKKFGVGILEMTYGESDNLFVKRVYPTAELFGNRVYPNGSE